MARSSANNIGQGSRRSNTISKIIDVIFKIWIFFLKSKILKEPTFKGAIWGPQKESVATVKLGTSIK